MDLLTAGILGLIQGLTEFLPISSSGHLVLAQKLLGFKGPSVPFDLMLHLGTTAAVLIFFRRDIAEILMSAFSGDSKAQGRRWIIMIILASIPTALIGLIFKHQLEDSFNSASGLAVQFWISGAILLLTDRIRTRDQDGDNIKVQQSLIVGVAQGLAIIPAISRSGATIAAGVMTGMGRKTAAKFSFLISIPAILGAMVLEAKDIGGLTQFDFLPTALGVLVAFLVGYLSIGMLIKMVVKRDLWIFAAYLFIIGLVTFVLI
jgi:undecaprenyl-diphosphatase